MNHFVFKKTKMDHVIEFVL